MEYFVASSKIRWKFSCPVAVYFFQAGLQLKCLKKRQLNFHRFIMNTLKHSRCLLTVSLITLASFCYVLLEDHTCASYFQHVPVNLFSSTWAYWHTTGSGYCWLLSLPLERFRNEAVCYVKEEWADFSWNYWSISKSRLPDFHQTEVLIALHLIYKCVCFCINFTCTYSLAAICNISFKGRLQPIIYAYMVSFYCSLTGQ